MRFSEPTQTRLSAALAIHGMKFETVILTRPGAFDFVLPTNYVTVKVGVVRSDMDTVSNLVEVVGGCLGVAEPWCHHGIGVSTNTPRETGECSAFYSIHYRFEDLAPEVAAGLLRQTLITTIGEPAALAEGRRLDRTEKRRLRRRGWKPRAESVVRALLSHGDR